MLSSDWLTIQAPLCLTANGALEIPPWTVGHGQDPGLGPGGVTMIVTWAKIDQVYDIVVKYVCAHALS